MNDFTHTKKKERTQDTIIIRPKYPVVPDLKEFPACDQSLFESERYLPHITKLDPIFSLYKLPRKTNYKPNIANSMGIFESTRTLGIVHSLLATIASINIKLGEKQGFAQEVEELKIKHEVYSKEMAELDIH